MVMVLELPSFIARDDFRPRESTCHAAALLDALLFALAKAENGADHQYMVISIHVYVYYIYYIHYIYIYTYNAYIYCNLISKALLS